MLFKVWPLSCCSNLEPLSSFHFQRNFAVLWTLCFLQNTPESALWKVYQNCGPLCDGVCSGLNSGPWIHLHLIPKTCKCGDFPGGPVVKNLPTNAGEVGSIPGQGTKIPHAMEQLSLSVATTELFDWREKSMHRKERFCMPQLRSDMVKNQSIKIKYLKSLTHLWKTKTTCKCDLIWKKHLFRCFEGSWDEEIPWII